MEATYPLGSIFHGIQGGFLGGVVSQLYALADSHHPEIALFSLTEEEPD